MSGGSWSQIWNGSWSGRGRLPWLIGLAGPVDAGPGGHAGRLGGSLAGTKVRRAFQRACGRGQRGQRKLGGAVSWPLDGSYGATFAAP